MSNMSELNDGKARHICTCTLRRAVIIHRSTFCGHCKRQTRRQQGEPRSVIYEKITLKSERCPPLSLTKFFVESNRGNSRFCEPRPKLNKGDQLSI